MAKAVTSNPPAAADLKADGRRYLPELVRGDIVLAHLHRYGLVELRADQRVNDADKQLLSNVCELIATIAGPESAALKGYLTSSWYRANNLDVTEAGNDLVEHWFIEGAKEGRIPAPNLKAVLQDVVSERESTIRQSLREAIVELQNAKKESLDRERDLEAEIEAAHRERRTIAAHLTASVERERNFTAQVLKETQQAAVRREADETEARHAEREWLLRDERQHIERETVEKLQRLERELVQTRSCARDEVNAVLVGMAARERCFVAEFSRQQELIDQERQHVRSQFLAIWDDLIAWIASLKRAPLHEKFALLRLADGILSLKLIRNRFAAPDESCEPAQVDGANAYVEGSIRAAATIAELFAREGEAFVACAYLTLLKREPDPAGLQFYSKQLSATGDKPSVVYQICRSDEAKSQQCLSVPGLRSLLWRERIRRIPLIGSFINGTTVNPRIEELRLLLRQIDNQVSKLGQTRHRQMSSFNAAGINAFEHLLKFGWLEGGNTAPIELAEALKVVAASAGNEEFWSNAESEYLAFDSSDPDVDRLSQVARRLARVNARFVTPINPLMQPGNRALQDDGYCVSRLMEYVWKLRSDLQRTFDIQRSGDRLEYIKWFVSHGTREFQFRPDAVPDSVLLRLARAGGEVGEQAIASLEQRVTSRECALSNLERLEPDAEEIPGVNIVGYARGEFGRGEDARMLARSLNAAQVDFCILDQNPGFHANEDFTASKWFTDNPRFNTNIFQMNADSLPLLYFKLADGFFENRYNIGYWAWELAKCPADFDLAMDMVDEIWCISDFVAESLRSRARVPVYSMPNPVSVPSLGPKYTKQYYGLPEDRFVFYFTFDSASYLDRKNPIAVVRAFIRAFPDGDSRTHLLLKTMNTGQGGVLWETLQAEVGDNPRITIFKECMTREDVMGLNLACDAFVSLHRAEGFGRCVAEAMAYGNPVIVTNYSGTREFATEDTACVVDFELIPVPRNAYPFCESQVWADPSVAHAAEHMQKLVSDAEFRTRIAAAGRRFIEKQFNLELLGQRYADRLCSIRREALGTGEQEGAIAGSAGPDGDIYGDVNSPESEQLQDASEVMAIGGWAAASKT